jgi:hypothetical protein
MRLAAVVAAAIAVAAALASATFTPQAWTDCSSRDIPGGPVAQAWGLSITPTPQYLWANWTLHYVVLPLITFDAKLDITVTIEVTLDGIPLHSMNISMCGTTNPIAKRDGYGACPYPAGVPQVIHDTNIVPGIFKGPYLSRVFYTSPRFPGKRLFCAVWNQTYANGARP